MEDVDELEINPFFNTLQNRFQDLYETAQEQCSLICIPTTVSLEDVDITNTFAQMHILKPSPFFKGQYVTAYSLDTAVTFDEKSRELVTGEGFTQQVRAKIINEELGYNKNYQPYKIFIIDKPLHAKYLGRQSEEKAAQLYTPKCSLKECKDFLQEYPEYKMVLRDLDDSLTKFNRNYLLLKDFLDDASSRIRTMSQNATKKCLDCTKHTLWVDPKFKEVLSSAIENYAVGSVHEKIFSVICDRFQSEDEYILQKCIQLQGLTPEHLKVTPEFSCSVPSAVEKLSNINGLKTPMEKMYHLKSTLDNITEEVTCNVQKKWPPGVGTEEIPCFTSDDLIPLLVTVIVQAKCSHMYSNIFYMENFYWAEGTKDRDNLSYCLVTLKAAVEFLKTANFDDLKLKKTRNKDEISIAEIIESTREVSLTSSSESGSADSKRVRPLKSSQSRYDEQFKSVSKILEETSKEHAKSQKQKKEVKSIFGDQFTMHQNIPEVVPREVPPHQNQQRKEKMGDFLSSLQDNIFQSYGKQN
ncbi:hypothetical protein ACJMK2_011408 [Sinanodonta woodiana]|uniref:VPS9 domain-containing protein n=1 Tax=Sinanodonta woodiana TaxID=1069815 RepID=A0ABD3V6Q7_SINWO